MDSGQQTKVPPVVMASINSPNLHVSQVGLKLHYITGNDDDENL